MAKITTITNPLTGQPAQVDQLDHTAQQIDDGLNIARGVSNPNLLDNWYFGNPVNQRGQTSYTGAGYGIDRWYLNISSSTAGGIQILDDCIQFIANGGTHIIEQRIEGLEDISGKTVTLSVLIDTFGLVSVTTALGSIKYKYFNGSNSVDGYMSVEQLSSGIVSIVIASNGTTRKVYAAKLELGSQQTLAHKDENGNWVLNEIPDYGEQLARCQRYFYRFPQIGNSYTEFGIGLAQNATKFYSVIKLPVSMRNGPSLVASGTFRLLSADFGTAVPVTSIDYNAGTKSASSDSIKIMATVDTGLTAGTPMYLQANNDTSAHIDFIADL